MIFLIVCFMRKPIPPLEICCECSYPILDQLEMSSRIGNGSESEIENTSPESLLPRNRCTRGSFRITVHWLGMVVEKLPASTHTFCKRGLQFKISTISSLVRGSNDFSSVTMKSPSQQMKLNSIVLHSITLFSIN